MARIYLLPPRPLLGEHFANYLRGLFPGLDWDEEARINLAEGLEAAATCFPEVFVVYRDDLPEGESTYRALVDGFGAEEGDEIIEIRAGRRPGELIAQRWCLRVAA